MLWVTIEDFGENGLERRWRPELCASYSGATLHAELGVIADIGLALAAGAVGCRNRLRGNAGRGGRRAGSSRHGSWRRRSGHRGGRPDALGDLDGEGSGVVAALPADVQ